jgi:hypothetical protein
VAVLIRIQSCRTDVREVTPDSHYSSIMSVYIMKRRKLLPLVNTCFEKENYRMCLRWRVIAAVSVYLIARIKVIGFVHTIEQPSKN